MPRECLVDLREHSLAVLVLRFVAADPEQVRG